MLSSQMVHLSGHAQFYITIGSENGTVQVLIPISKNHRVKGKVKFIVAEYIPAYTCAINVFLRCNLIAKYHLHCMSLSPILLHGLQRWVAGCLTVVKAARCSWWGAASGQASWTRSSLPTSMEITWVCHLTISIPFSNWINEATVKTPVQPQTYHFWLHFSVHVVAAAGIQEVNRYCRYTLSRRRAV